MREIREWRKGVDETATLARSARPHLARPVLAQGENQFVHGSGGSGSDFLIHVPAWSRNIIGHNTKCTI